MWCVEPFDAFSRSEKGSGLTQLSAPAGRNRRVSPSLQAVVERALDGETISREAAYHLVSCDGDQLPALCGAAAKLRDRGKGRTVTFSPKVFIPLTRLCRDFCGYCTFRQSPAEADALFLTLDQVLAVAEAGKRAGCTEALFTLGERPEQRYAEAKRWLRAAGYRSTLHYLRDAASRVMHEVGLLPHLNPGTMSRRELAALRPVSASMGIMLENVSARLAAPGAPHHEAPSKWPRARLQALELAGRERVAFTTGLLVGIGESREERIDSLVAIRDLNDRHGHIQEVIVQNFRAKAHTPMRQHPDTSTDEMLWTVAAARLILGEGANIQVPPNLNDEHYPVFLDAGINDWGGVSPVTIDYVNPEAPWPHLRTLRKRTESRGFRLKPRLPIYPELVTDGGRLIPMALNRRILQLTDGHGFVKGGMDCYA
jgi:7,8-didemethyl-8-hydroxy-5-deazariboflavin synthase CofG subunit